MKKTEKTKSEVLFELKKSMISTIWVVGAGMLSGSALSGKVHV